MWKSSKKLINDLSNGKDLEENVKKYIHNFANLYYRDGFLKGVFEYYTLYEQSLEMEKEEKEYFLEILPVIQRCVSVFLSETTHREEIREVIELLHNKRKKIIDRVDVLTAYVDRIQIYEYVLNRMELNHKEIKIETSQEEGFAKGLMQYIFSQEDNMVINERIKEVLSQLPVRITKSHYFDLVRNSLSIYKGCEKEDVENYLYRFNTGAMLYKPKGTEYFPDYKKRLQGLAALDYSNLTKEEYSTGVEDIKLIADAFIHLTDLYINCQTVLNCFYAALEAYSILEEKQEWKEEEYAREILCEIHALFERNADFDCLESSSFEHMEKNLILLEGKQEAWNEEIIRYEGILYDLTQKGNHEKALFSLGKIGQLLSSGIFVDFDKVPSKEIADETYIGEKTSELINDLEELFQENKKQINRAIMANTMKAMPVFFNSTEEILKYIENSLEQCRDYSEKTISIKLLKGIMEEDGYM